MNKLIIQTTLLFLLIIFLNSSCLVLKINDLVDFQYNGKTTLNLKGFYYSGSIYQLHDTTTNSYKDNYWRKISILFFYDNGFAFRGQLFADFIEDTNEFNKKNNVLISNMADIKVRGNTNNYLDKLRILSMDTVIIKSGIPWCKYKQTGDTILMKCLDVQTDDPFFPQIEVEHYLYVLADDSTLILTEYKDRFHDKPKKFFNQKIPNIRNRIELSDYVFKYYEYTYKPDTSNSFFNTNKDYLKYIKKRNKY